MSVDFLKKIELFPKTIELIAFYKFRIKDNSVKAMVGNIQDNLTRFSKYYLWWVVDSLSGGNPNLNDSDVGALEEYKIFFRDLISEDSLGLEQKIVSNLGMLSEFVRSNKNDLTIHCNDEIQLKELVNSINLVKYDLGD
ncbi:MAG: hypothetical protein ISQ34_03535 [Rickettsiales bacterium]|nr:hypothetical protein [Rickettsiales bacterium]